MKIVKCRCTSCESHHVFVNQSLDDVRTKVCERCGIKLTVVSSEGQIDPPPVPAAERLTITERTTAIARGLVLSALGEEG